MCERFTPGWVLLLLLLLSYFIVVGMCEIGWLARLKANVINQNEDELVVRSGNMLTTYWVATVQGGLPGSLTRCRYFVEHSRGPRGGPFDKGCCAMHRSRNVVVGGRTMVIVKEE